VILGGDGSILGGSVARSDLSDEQVAALETLAAVRLPAEPEPEPEAIEPEPDAGG
jgi:hypothetical protein